MANEAAKKRVRENAARLRGLRLALAVAVALHAAFTFLLSSRRPPLWHTALFLLCSLLTAAAYGFLRRVGRPEYGPAGELRDGGADLKVGVAEAAADVIALVCGVLVLSLASNAAWLLLLLVPARASHWAWVNLLGPWFFAGGDDGGSAAKLRTGERDAKQKTLRRRA